MSSRERIQEVIFFFSKEGITKEMMFTEFEAVLDGVVGIEDLAGQLGHAVFCEINAGLRPESLVFFTLEFDLKGEPPRLWNLPFQQLISKSQPQPLDHSMCRIVSKSQCGIDSHKGCLWDPNQENFDQIKNKLIENNLFLPSHGGGDNSLDPTPHVQPAFSQQNFEQVQGVKTLGTLSTSAFQTLKAEVDQASKEQIEKLEAELKVLKNDLNEALFKHKEYELQLTDQRKNYKNFAANVQLKLKQQGDEIKLHYEQQMKKIEVKFKKQLQDRSAQFNELVKTKDKEVYQIQIQNNQLEFKIKQMSEELLGFRKDKMRLMNEGTDKFFERLEKAGLSFIAFHPGAGHVSISVDSMMEYLANPKKFAAAKCNITEETYDLWLEHHEKPLCNAHLMGDKVCNKRIPRADLPQNFTPGLSDRCERHQSTSSTIGRVFSS